MQDQFFFKIMLHHNNVIKSKKNSNLLKFINKLSEKLKKNLNYL